MPRVSVVVPFLNAARWLPACLAGLARQSLPRDEAEFLFVDNNSTDSGPDIVRSHDWVRLLKEPSVGAYAARNRALKEATGDVIAFLDPDCVPAPDWLARILQGTSDPAVGILIGGYTLADRPAAVRPLVAYENEKTYFVYESSDPTVYFGHTNNMAVRASLLVEAGGFVVRRRGSDTILVRSVVDRHGTSVARADERMLVSHLEVDSLRTYYAKLFTYGRSREAYRGLSFTRSLTAEERLIVFRRTARRNGYGPAGAAMLLCLLAVGMVCWAAGRALGRAGRGLGRLTRGS